MKKKKVIIHWVFKVVHQVVKCLKTLNSYWVSEDRNLINKVELSGKFFDGDRSLLNEISIDSFSFLVKT